MNNVKLFDTHCHLTLGALAQQSEAAWTRAQEAGVSRALVVGIDRQSCQEVQEWISGRDGLYGCLGIHPNETNDSSNEDFEMVFGLCDSPKIVAVGETGIDLHWDRSPIEVQRKALEVHADFALSKNLPLVLHIRDAYPHCAEVLKNYCNTELKAIVHSFAGAPKDLEPYLKMGYWISFSGILTYPKANELREAASLVPLDKCLVETDAPYLPPQPVRGKMNEPAFVVHTAQRLAEIHGVSLSDLAQTTTNNALEVFGLS